MHPSSNWRVEQGVVWYYREAGEAQPSPQSAEVVDEVLMNAVFETRLHQTIQSSRLFRLDWHGWQTDHQMRGRLPSVESALITGEKSPLHSLRVGAALSWVNECNRLVTTVDKVGPFYQAHNCIEKI